MADAADFALDDIFSFREANNLKNHWAGTTAPTNPTQGLIWYDTANDLVKYYDGADWVALAKGLGAAPVGSIVAWAGGYFTDGSNGGYTYQLGSANTVAGANSYLNALGWYVCDGAALNDSDSPIYNGAGRYLPNLDDSRFLMGGTSAGTAGGSNTRDHTHDVDVASVTSSGPSSTSNVTGGATTVAHSGHTHDFDPDSATSGSASVTENRPQYLSCFMIQRVK